MRVHAGQSVGGGNVFSLFDPKFTSSRLVIFAKVIGTLMIWLLKKFTSDRLLQSASSAGNYVKSFLNAIKLYSIFKLPMAG